jgi:uncharacterized protein with gpF-like domain
MKDRALMNTLGSTPIPYYNHFLFKESLDLKNSLIQSAKEYKALSVRIKDNLKRLGRLDHAELEKELMDQLRNFQNLLEKSLKDLRAEDDILFDLQKSLQSNKVYDESFQKTVRKECKSNLQIMDSLLKSAEEVLIQSEQFISELSYSNVSEKSVSRISLDWILNLPVLFNFEKRIIR